MFYSHSNKKIILLRLKIKKNSFTNYFIISFKRSYRNFDVIWKTHFKRVEFVIRFFFIYHEKGRTSFFLIKVFIC